MQFDVFHSIGRIDSVLPKLTDRQVFQQFIEQTCLAESLGYKTIWVAESHFSSEVQKSNPEAVIPYYQGEVGLNADSPQLAGLIFSRTGRIGFGTAIFNIVGGNGGPIGAADRIRSLAFLNQLQETPRNLNIGIAAGRFPYINKPFGVVPRNETETVLWEAYRKLIFVEALEVFLRLSRSEVLSSDQIGPYAIDASFFKDDAHWRKTLQTLHLDETTSSIPYQLRWKFEPLKLVPEIEPKAQPRFVLGSSDALSRQVGLQFADLDIFNLSFTPSEIINKTHGEMAGFCALKNRQWHRSRMPRTVLVFAHPNSKKAHEIASQSFDTYIEAMRGTVGTPPKEALMARALIGDEVEIREQLSSDNYRGFHRDDRLMLWFEFGQSQSEEVMRQMRYFSEKIAAHYVD